MTEEARQTFLSGDLPASPPPPSPTPGGGEEEELATAVRKKTRRPKRYRVLLHNDDYTPMDFVVEVLVKHFRKAPAEANHVMLEVHYKGVGVAGIYPREIAETKVAEVIAHARAEGHPLMLSAEAE